MRLGGPIANANDPDSWIADHRKLGYRAGNVRGPAGSVAHNLPDDVCKAYREAAKKADIVIAEVGAWSNPLSADANEAQKAFDKCVAALACADRLGACCCVNISGACGDVWDGPHPDNISRETFDRIVEITRRIIDQVNPTQTVFALESMPWALPDSPESYLELLQAIDRPKQFGVHLDPINMINSPRRYFECGKFVRHCFEILGPHIVSCHTKDLKLGKPLTITMQEVPITQGGFDHHTYLEELNKLDADIPLMMEHMKPEEYGPAAEHLRAIASEIGVSL